MSCGTTRHIMAVTSVFTASVRSQLNKCAPLPLRSFVIIPVWLLYYCCFSCEGLKRQFGAKSLFFHRAMWMENSIINVGHLQSFNHLGLMRGLGWPAPRLFWSHRSDGDTISQSHCQSSHISVLAYPCSVGNIKKLHFLPPIQSHICHFQTHDC